MKKWKISLLAIIVISSCQPQTKTPRPEFALAIHGGAGSIKPGQFSPVEEKEFADKLEEALKVGYKILENGGTSLECVEKVVNVLEDSPLFNAGKGAVFTNAGTNELDAAIMDGKTLNAGTVAGIKRVKNPITLARLVMMESPHVMMIGDGAEKFGEMHGVEFVDPEYFYTERRWESLQKILEREKLSLLDNDNDYKFGTVGCVALDKDGNLAAATSTGGMTNKRWGRVGDVPIIGAGTYADNNTCAISATGHGEYFIRNVVAYQISSLIEHARLSLEAAADSVVMRKLVKQNGSGGVIAIDKFGNISMPFNSEGMFRGSFKAGEEPVVAMFAN